MSVTNNSGSSRRTASRISRFRRQALAVVASLALTGLIGGAVVGTASADGVGDQKQKVQQIVDQLDNISNHIDQLDSDYNQALDTQDQLNTKIADSQAKIATQQAQLDRLRGTLSKIAVGKYTTGTSTDLSPVFSDAASYSDAQQRDELNRLSLDNGAGDVNEATALATQLAKEKSNLDSKQKQATKLVASLDQKKADADRLETDYTTQLAAAKAQLGDLIQQEQDRRAAAQLEVVAKQNAAAAAAASAAVAANQAQSVAPTTDRTSGPRSGNGNASATSNPAPSATAPRGGGGNAAANNGGGSTPPVVPAPKAPTPSAPPAAPPAAPPPSSRAGVAVAAAMAQLGVPYRFAAESPGSAFDCSGLTKYAWGVAGVSLPHQSAQQYASTPHISRDQIQPGDLLYYHSPIGHVAIYLGNGQLIHAPRTGDVVRIAAVNWASVVGISRPG